MDMTTDDPATTSAPPLVNPYQQRIADYNARLQDAAAQSRTKQLRLANIAAMMSGDPTFAAVGDYGLKEAQHRLQREDAERARLEDRSSAWEGANAEARQRAAERAEAVKAQQAWQAQQAAQAQQWQNQQRLDQRAWQESQNALNRAAMGTQRAAQQDARNWTVEDRMSDDYVRDTRTQQQVLNAHKSLAAIAQKGDAASDIAFIYSYMKMLDPGSVVREGEFATAQNAAGVPARIQNLYNAAMSGARLNAQQRAEMLDTAGRLGAEAQAQMDSTMEQYTAKANRRGLNAENVTGRLYAPRVLMKTLGGGGGRAPVAPAGGGGGAVDFSALPK